MDDRLSVAEAVRNILMVEDDPRFAQMLAFLVDVAMKETARTESVDRLSKALEYMGSQKFDLVLLDLDLPDSQGLNTLRSLLHAQPEAPVIVLTGRTEEEAALQALRIGAIDYIVKGRIDVDFLRRALRYGLERACWRRRHRESHSRLETVTRLQESNQVVIRGERLSSLGIFSTGATQEILNPVNVIGMYAQRLLAESREGSREREAAEVIYRNVQRIGRICDGLRWFSRDEPLRQEPFDLVDVLQQCLRPLEGELRLKNIGFETQFSEGPQFVFGDRNQIQQVCLNLLQKAVEAMPEGGRLTTTLGEVAEKGARWRELSVADTGTGISPEIMPRIFDPFFTTKSGDKGTGLGLSVSHGIVEAHGGRIWAESQPGKGTTFIVRLPFPEERK